jgi:large subunit ribosomal protein L25
VPAEHIPQFIEVDVGDLEINNSRHLSEVTLPAGARAISRGDATLVTIVPPSGYGEEQKAAATAAAPAAGALLHLPLLRPAAAAKAPAAAAKAPAGGAKK